MPLAGSRDLWSTLRMAPTPTVLGTEEPAGLADSEITATDALPAVKRPRTYDPDWREKIERAKTEWENGRKAREGKPIVFSIDDLRHLH